MKTTINLSYIPYFIVSKLFFNTKKSNKQEKERLQNIVNMCASLMNGTELEDDENYIPDKNTTSLFFVQL